LKVEVLAVGKELLIGRTINTNANWIGGRLAKMGGALSRVTTIDDDVGEISSTLREVLGRRPDFVIVIGGLGPTPDDMTLKGIAKGLSRGIRMNPLALEMVRQHYAKVGRQGLELTVPRRKMARLPRGATPLENKFGTAPGVRLESGGTLIFALPGVPTEMKGIFRDFVQKEIKQKIGTLHRGRVVLKVGGIFESSLAPILKQTMKRYPNAYIKSHPKGVEEGVSRLELDIVVTTPKKEDSRNLSIEIASGLERKIVDAGGTVTHKTRVRR